MSVCLFFGLNALISGTAGTNWEINGEHLTRFQFADDIDDEMISPGGVPGKTQHYVTSIAPFNGWVLTWAWTRRRLCYISHPMSHLNPSLLTVVVVVFTFNRNWVTWAKCIFEIKNSWLKMLYSILCYSYWHIITSTNVADFFRVSSRIFPNVKL